MYPIWFKMCFGKFGDSVKPGLVLSQKSRFNVSLIIVEFVEDPSVFYNFGPNAFTYYT